MLREGTVKGLLDLCRVSNLPTVWTNVLTASLLVDASAPPQAVFLLAAAFSSFYLAGMALNDLCDLEYDRVHKVSRPLPSGQVTVRSAACLTAFLAGAGFGIFAVSPHKGAFVGAVLLCSAIVVYDLRHKGNAWSVLVMGSCRFLVFAVASLSLAGRVTGPAALAGACQFCYVVLISLVARYESGRGGFSVPVIPLMLAGISLLDGLLLALFLNPVWLLMGVAGWLLTLMGQRFVRGD